MSNRTAKYTKKSISSWSAPYAIIKIAGSHGKSDDGQRASAKSPSARNVDRCFERRDHSAG